MKLILLALVINSYMSFGSSGELIQKIDELISNNNSRKSEYDHQISIGNEPDKFDKCDNDKKQHIQKLKSESYDSVKKWLISFKEFEQSNPELIKTRKVIKKISCISNRISGADFSCMNKTKQCKGGSWAHTLPYVDSNINICDSTFQRSKDHQRGIILHEVSHKCGTTDIDNFYFKKPPKSSFFVHWSSIADTYEYWEQEGFCIPEYNCKIKTK